MQARKQKKDLSEPFGKGETWGDFAVKRGEFQMGVQIEKAGSQGKAGQFKNLLFRQGPKIRSDFLDGTAGDPQPARTEDAVRCGDQRVGENQHEFSGRRRLLWTWRGGRRGKASRRGGSQVPSGR